MNTTNVLKPVHELIELLAFVKHGLVSARTTGTVAPSSPALAECIIRLAELQGCRSVVEFGPGTGAVTEVILESLPNGCDFFAIEINPEFVSILQKKYPHLAVIQDSAANVVLHLKNRGLEMCDCIISGLPWALFEDDLQREILNAAYESLAPGGRFITFTYFFSIWTKGGKRFRRMLNERFGGKVKLSSVVWANFPPARVYCAMK